MYAICAAATATRVRAYCMRRYVDGMTGYHHDTAEGVMAVARVDVVNARDWSCAYHDEPSPHALYVYSAHCTIQRKLCAEFVILKIEECTRRAECGGHHHHHGANYT